MYSLLTTTVQVDFGQKGGLLGSVWPHQSWASCASFMGIMHHSWASCIIHGHHSWAACIIHGHHASFMVIMHHSWASFMGIMHHSWASCALFMGIMCIIHGYHASFMGMMTHDLRPRWSYIALMGAAPRCAPTLGIRVRVSYIWSAYVWRLLWYRRPP